MLARPILLTLVAAVLVAVAVLHVEEPAPAKAPPCEQADRLRDAGLLADARTGYVKLLAEKSPPKCVTTGLDIITGAACKRAKALETASPGDAVRAYRAILAAEPVRHAAACARSGLGRLPASAKEEPTG
jgi:hypothetical protein